MSQSGWRASYFIFFESGTLFSASDLSFRGLAPVFLYLIVFIRYFRLSFSTSCYGHIFGVMTAYIRRPRLSLGLFNDLA